VSALGSIVETDHHAWQELAEEIASMICPDEKKDDEAPEAHDQSIRSTMVLR
jgi:hypothetical protein